MGKIRYLPDGTKINPMSKRKNPEGVILRLNRIKKDKGIWLSPQGNLLAMFNCGNCSWIASLLCPHHFEKGEHHANNYCSERINFMKEVFILAGTKPRYLQVEEAFKLKMIEDNLIREYSDTGDLPPDFVKVSKNLITLLDKMRRQDEGIKVQGEILHTHEELIKIVESQASEVKGKDIVKEAELIDKKDNGSTD